jgi:hypothetical protein
MRIQARHLTWCGQGTRGCWSQGPPLSGSGAVAIEPGNDAPGRRASCDGAIRARNAVRSDPSPVLPCIRQNWSQSASACHSRAQRSREASLRERCSSKTSIPAPRLHHSLCAGSLPRSLDLATDPAAAPRARRGSRRPVDLCVLPAVEIVASARRATAWPDLPLPLWLESWDAGAPGGEQVLCVRRPEVGPNCSDALAPSARPFRGAARPWYLAGPQPDTIIPSRPAVAKKRESRHIDHSQATHRAWRRPEAMMPSTNCAANSCLV